MRYILFAALLLSGLAAQACNTCGCAAGNQFLGILPQMSGHFVGMQYQHRWYESYHDATEPDKPAERQLFHEVQLWGRYSFRRFQVYAFLPWQYNIKGNAGDRSVLSGIGDASVLVNYQALRPATDGQAWKHFLLAGAGLKMPTGKYDNSVLGSGDDFSPAMQVGSGSWDYLANANYTLQHGLWGLNAEAGFTLTTPNHQTYKYGNRLSGSLQAFRQWNGKNRRLLPAAGLRLEQASQDYDNYPSRSLAQYTGGYMLYATAGFRAFSRHKGVELSYHQPVAQHYGDGLVSSRGRVVAGFVYLF